MFKKTSKSPVSSDGRVIRLRPYNYIHVLDNNTNIAHVEVGPKTFIRKDHEQIVLSPTAMINIPPRSYCTVGNPALRDEEGSVILSENSQTKLQHGEREVRIFTEWTSPFPLYPGEVLQTSVRKLTVVSPNTALKCRAVRDFTDDAGVMRMAGDEWLFHGPGTYLPRVEVGDNPEIVVAQVIRPNQALKLRAKRKFADRKKIKRVAGEQWLVKEQGSYLPDVFEEVVGVVRARVLTEKRALHLRADHTFVDAYSKERKAGQEWLVTHLDGQTHIPSVYETVVGEVHITTLSKQQYAVVVNPIGEDGIPVWGKRDLRMGERSFFLLPGETLEAGVQQVEVLGEEEALLLRANEKFTSNEGEEKEGAVDRNPGEEWMIYGPRKYVPSVEVTILERRSRIPMDENEGIYVRNLTNGKVYTVKGQTYMLKPNEALHNKELPEVVEKLLHQAGYRGLKSRPTDRVARIAHKMVVFRVPHNAAVQVYDYKTCISRVVFGPELVMLEPDEQFTIVTLSGGIPKRPNEITSLCLQLGPDFMNDVVVVETGDHARLKLKLSYNWKFEVDKTDAKQAAMIFSVRDFIGDACKAIASRVRGAVASETFDDFHKNSAEIIRKAVFGSNPEGDTNQRLLFSANLLSVTNIDIQSVEPVEQRTKDALQKSVQLAIEIATASQEALANHEAAREEQIAEGKLQRQRIRDQAGAEEDRKSLVELKAKTAAVESTGQAKAEAIARSEASLIKGAAAVKQAQLKTQAAKIRHDARIQQLRLKQKQELIHREALDSLEIDRTDKEARIEAEKFKSIVAAIGPDTIKAIAQAGPEMQAKLLEGLGLQGFLVTDGSSPINLFNTASGLVSTQ